MTRSLSFTMLALLSALSIATAQPNNSQNENQTVQSFNQTAKYPERPSDMLELGLHLGHAYIGGDLDYVPGFGAGFHWRKALGYSVSLRGNYTFFLLRADSENAYNGSDIEANPVLNGLGYGSNNNDDAYQWNTRTMAHDLSLDVVFNLNNIQFHKATSNWGVYTFVGAGLMLYDPQYDSDVTDENDFSIQGVTNNKDGNTYKLGTTGTFKFGLGLSRRLNAKTNLSLDQSILFVFDDNLDGKSFYAPGTPTKANDLISYTNLRLNFNIGDAGSKSEPMYWMNPLDAPFSRIEALENKDNEDPLADTDGDGVPDKLDKEMNTPAGAIVDTRGVTLDSDKDGVPDYKDKEPFSSPNSKVDASGVGGKVSYLTEEEAKKLGEKEGWYKKESSGRVVSGSMSDWFLPMIHFDVDKTNIKAQYYSQLHHVGSLMQKNAGMRVVVEGHADASGSTRRNENLAYERAENAINYLVKNYNISRSNLILNYKGESAPLPGSSANNFMNRRVEFKVANGGETDMSRPK